ncbi:MAG TPA: hypothetical protein VFQ30_02600 [Ktedonobacteraceae bacterium]|nr:hypothetical protein [Ktedonobacteraceae bacterium]
MDAIIGRYRVRLDENGILCLQHPTGIAFDMTAEEALELLDFLGVYQQALQLIARQTDPKLKSISVEKIEEQNEI